MKLDQSFEVKAGVEEVWKVLVDVERVAPCLPGAEITEVGEDGTYTGDFKVKLGPTTAAYRGTLKMESLDEAQHVATMSANGQEKRGQGSAKATIVSRMTESGGVTRVEVDTDFTLTGRLSRLGRGGMIEDVANRLLRDFADCLKQDLEQSQGEIAAREEASAAGEASESQPAVEPQPAVEDDPSSQGEPAVEREPASKPQPASRPSSSPRRSSEPVSGASLLLSVLLDRARPVLLPIVARLREALERLEDRMRER